MTTYQSKRWQRHWEDEPELLRQAVTYVVNARVILSALLLFLPAVPWAAAMATRIDGIPWKATGCILFLCSAVFYQLCIYFFLLSTRFPNPKHLEDPIETVIVLGTLLMFAIAAFITLVSPCGGAAVFGGYGFIVSIYFLGTARSVRSIAMVAVEWELSPDEAFPVRANAIADIHRAIEFFRAVCDWHWRIPTPLFVFVTIALGPLLTALSKHVSLPEDSAPWWLQMVGCAAVLMPLIFVFAPLAERSRIPLIGLTCTIAWWVSTESVGRLVALGEQTWQFGTLLLACYHIAICAAACVCIIGWPNPRWVSLQAEGLSQHVDYVEHRPLGAAFYNYVEWCGALLPPVSRGHLSALYWQCLSDEVSNGLPPGAYTKPDWQRLRFAWRLTCQVLQFLSQPLLYRLREFLAWLGGGYG